jgi:hypothetical protein
VSVFHSLKWYSLCDIVINNSFILIFGKVVPMRSLLQVVIVITISFDLYAGESESLVFPENQFESIYRLYHTNETVSLRSGAYRVGIGGVYTQDNHHVRGIHEYRRQINTQAHVAYGISEHVEASIAVPVGWKYRISESEFMHESEHNIGGFEQVVTRVIASTMMAGFETSGVLSVHVPTEETVLAEDGVLSTLEIHGMRSIQSVFVYGGVSLQRAWRHESNTVGFTGGFGYYLNNVCAFGVQFSDIPEFNPELGAVRDIATTSLHLAYQITPLVGIVSGAGMGMSRGAPQLSVDTNVYFNFE